VSAGVEGAPLLVRPVIGFRQWRLRDGVLHSMWTDDRWDGGVLRARCRAETFDAPVGPNPAPESDCNCGVHAWHRQVPLGASGLVGDLVAGAVALWGEVEVHATGMRGERGKIVALALPLGRGRKRLELAVAAGELGVDLVPHRHLLAAAMAHGAPVPHALRPSR
jgi:hypothetical protein